MQLTFASFSNYAGIVRTLALILLPSHFSLFSNVPASCGLSLSLSISMRFTKDIRN